MMHSSVAQWEMKVHALDVFAPARLSQRRWLLYWPLTVVGPDGLKARGYREWVPAYARSLTHPRPSRRGERCISDEAAPSTDTLIFLDGWY